MVEANQIRTPARSAQVGLEEAVVEELLRGLVKTWSRRECRTRRCEEHQDV
jgi:hypothetical protein